MRVLGGNARGGGRNWMKGGKSEGGKSGGGRGRR